MSNRLTCCLRFQSTLPARGATGDNRCAVLFYKHFNPRSPHGERRNRTMICFAILLFQSTLPARGATRAEAQVKNMLIFQSTLPARGATSAVSCFRSKMLISIHAPRTGSDDDRAEGIVARRRISIHAPRTGSDFRRRSFRRRGYISIHAPRTGSDTSGGAFRALLSRFQSTLPARGATKTRNQRE